MLFDVFWHCKLKNNNIKQNIYLSRFLPLLVLGGDGSIPGKSRGNDQQNELATKKGKLAQEGGSLQNGTT